MMLHTNIKALGLMVSDMKIFSCFSTGQGHFWPQVHNLNKLGRSPPGHAAYEGSRPRWDHFWTQGHNENKFGRGPIGDATYQLSRL